MSEKNFRQKKRNIRKSFRKCRNQIRKKKILWNKKFPIRKDYDQPAEEEAEPYEEAEVTSYETQPVEPVQEEATYEEPVQEEIVQEEVGDINPYTGREYESNSVRMHPKRIGYVQVYDRANHKWTDMTEWAFLGYQERKKVLLERITNRQFIWIKIKMDREKKCIRCERFLSLSFLSFKNHIKYRHQ